MENTRDTTYFETISQDIRTMTEETTLQKLYRLTQNAETYLDETEAHAELVADMFDNHGEEIKEKIDEFAKDELEDLANELNLLKNRITDAKRNILESMEPEEKKVQEKKNKENDKYWEAMIAANKGKVPTVTSFS